MEWFCEESKEDFEFDGCLFYGCDQCGANKDPVRTLQEFHSFNGKRNEDIKRKTPVKVEKLKEAGYWVHSKRECEWKELRKRSDVTDFIKTLRCVRFRFQLYFEEIFNRIKKG